ncbi:MAG: LssY C-terminal domain-containing protein [Deltaproteobacteria bacterium]|nr:LssY C-terminal domain-containing protein [Candidatus Tharpella aukensis]
MNKKSFKKILPVLLLSLLLTSCAQYRHTQRYELDFFQRAQTRIKGDVEVSVAVLSAEESAELFGVFVAETGVQPVWIRIRNNDPMPYSLYSIGLDPRYFSPHEAAWKNHFTFAGFSNVQMDSNFRRHGIYPYVPSGETVSGFIYTRLNEGVKAVSIDLKSPGGEGKSFFFMTPIPGFRGDSTDLFDHTGLYPKDGIAHIETLDELRSWIEALPSCVFGKDCTSLADPLNLIMIGHSEDIGPAFVHRGWELAESAHFRAVWKMIKSSLFGSNYRYSPMSALFMYGRKQDVALQKARNTIDERNHLRLWYAPARFKEMPILVGQISRDIGVRLTGKLFPPTTHVIDPEVDEARWYLEQDLTLSQRVRRVGLAQGVGRAPEKKPKHNLMGDPYYTDGFRLVVIFTNEPTSFSQIDYLDWEIPEDIRYLILENR